MSDSSKVTVNYFCVGALLIFVGCVLICSLGFTIVLPYELTKNWPEVKCRVLNSSYNPHLCSCEEGYGGLEQYYGNGWMHNRMNLNKRSNEAASNLSEGMFEFHDSFSDRFFHHPTCSSKFPCLQILVEYYFQARKNDIKFNRNLTTTDAQISEDPTSLPLTNFPATSTKSRLRRSFDDRSIFPRFSNHKNHKYHSRKSKVIKRSLVDPSSETTETTLEPPSTTDQSIPFTTTSATHDVSKRLQKRGIAYLYRSWDDSFHSRCTLIECGDEIWNVKENRKFRKEWGTPGKTFTCFYNPVNLTVAIKEKTSPVVVMHAILWPALSLLIGAIIWICLCCGCCKSGKDSACKEKYKIVS